MRFRAKTNAKRQLDIRWEQINAYLAKWKPGTLLDIEIVRHQSTISDPMRKLYFAAVLPPFARHMGYDPDEYKLVHRQLKIVFYEPQGDVLAKYRLPPITKDKRGIYRNVPRVFAKKSKFPVKEKKRFLDWVLRKSAQEGCYIDI